MSITVELQYFASLRDRTGVEHERLSTSADTLEALYRECDARHGLGWPIAKLRVAANGEFARWDDPVADGDRVAFIPPVSGG
ncbi:MAG: MoaD/ThiS family protein [Lysobacteraceae bacterium]